MVRCAGMTQTAPSFAPAAAALEARVKQEGIRTVFAFNRGGVALTLLLAPVTAWRMSGHVAQGRPYWAWAAYMVVIALLRLALGVAFVRAVRREDTRLPFVAYSRGLVVLASATGLGWGALSHPSFAPDDTAALLLCSLLYAICAIALFGFAAYLPAFYAILFPIVLALLSAASVSASPFAGEWFVMTLLFGVILTVGSSRLSRTIAGETRSRLLASALRDEAFSASKAKSQFLANMSHEIRTPLNGVLGLTELMLAEELPASVRMRLETIRESGASLIRIVGDVLDLSSLEHGKLQIVRSPFDLEKCAREVTFLFEAQLRAKQLSISVRCVDDQNDLLDSDGARIRQVLTNLVSNAIKFTECGQVRVRIGCGAIRSHELGEIVSVRVEVTDTGIGIPQAVESTIFDAFTQADASTTRRYGGTGLGLAICRDLVALMGGTIGVHSRLGQGSTFWLTLPLEIAGVQDNPPNLPGGDSGPEPANRRTIRLADSGGYLGRVLVAEDDAINRKVAAGFLGGLGYHVQFAENGAEAVAAAAASPFDLIFMDCQMTVMDGFEATQQIRSTEHGQRRTPIIALTASALQTDRQRCLEAGMDDHLTKPIRRADLSAVLARFAQHKAHSVEHALPPVTHPPADDQVRAAIAARLADLFEGLDDHDIANETSALIQSYRDRAQNYLIELTRASVDGDLDRLQHLAHALRGMASNVGADVVAASAKEIEEAARLGGLSNIDNSLDGLRAAISRADDAAALVLPQH